MFLMWLNRNWHLKTPPATLISFELLRPAHERRVPRRQPLRPLRWQSTMMSIQLLPLCLRQVPLDSQSFLPFPLDSQNSLRFSLDSHSFSSFRLDSQRYCCGCHCLRRWMGSAIVIVITKTMMSTRMVMWRPIVGRPSKSYDSVFQSMH